jgi:hypothetical protein
VVGQHEVRDRRDRLLGHPEGDEAGIRGSNGQDIREPLVFDDDVRHGSVEIDATGGEMQPLAEPVSVGVVTRCPWASMSGTSLRQHQPPCQAPWTST